MIWLLHGKDPYRVRATFRRIRKELAAGDEQALAANTSTLDGRTVTPDVLLAQASAVPFLADRRLVVVEGLLRALGEGRGRRKKGADDPLDAWRSAAPTLANSAVVPESNAIVLLEGELDTKNAAFTIFAPIARVIDHPLLSQGELAQWISEEAVARRVDLAPRAIAALAQLIGPDLWALDNELEKLAAWSAGETVEPQAVADMVSAAREAKIWDMTDAIVEGKTSAALESMRRLLDDGQPPPVLLTMIVRQFRQLVIIKDMRERRARNDEMQRASGVPAFRLSAVGALASRFSWTVLREAYAVLVESDLAVKRGLQDDQTALQLAVERLCALAPARSAARAR